MDPVNPHNTLTMINPLYRIERSDGSPIAFFSDKSEVVRRLKGMEFVLQVRIQDRGVVRVMSAERFLQEAA